MINKIELWEIWDIDNYKYVVKKVEKICIRETNKYYVFAVLNSDGSLAFETKRQKIDFFTDELSAWEEALKRLNHSIENSNYWIQHYTKIIEKNYEKINITKNKIMKLRNEKEVNND